MWVPPKVSAELVAEREAFNAEMRERAALGHMKGVMDEFNYELRRIDPHLSMLFVPEDANTVGTPCRAGYYHVLRDNPGAPMSVMVVEGENGEPVEPTHRLFQKLREGDLWNPQVMRGIRRAERLAEEAEHRQKMREREDRQGELVERWAASTRTQVSMNKDTAWSQNAAGARAAKASRKDKTKAA